LDRAKIKKIKATIDHELEEAVSFAVRSPYPEKSELTKYVFTE